MPPIVVTGKDDTVTSRHKSHVEEKIKKLNRFFDGIQKMEILLASGGQQGKGSEAELLISVSGGKRLVCHSKARDIYSAVDLIIDKAEKQLTRHKEKLRDHKGLKTRGHEPVDEVKADEDEEDYQDIVEKRSFS